MHLDMLALRTSHPAGSAPAMPAHPVVLFDGVCNFCNNAVNFLIDHDPERRLRFAAIQSDAGTRLRREFAIGGDPLETLILIEAGQAHLRSTAFLRALVSLHGAWRLASWLQVVPRAVRDPIYVFVARHRYRWFGARISCRVPAPEYRERFLN